MGRYSKKTGKSFRANTPVQTAAVNEGGGNTLTRETARRGLPVGGGRSSVPEYGYNGGVYEGMLVTPDIPRNLIEICEKLVIWNDDFSFAVSNLSDLGATDYKVLLPDNMPRRAAAIEEIKAFRRNAYMGGDLSLVSDLFTQISLTGAISGEGIPDMKLNGLEGIEIVSPKYVQFVYQNGRWVKYQNVGAGGDRKDVTGYGVRLNELTYKYIPLRRINEKPYGISTLLSSFEGIKIENEMLCQLKEVIKKYGVWGFLEVLSDPPEQIDGEGLEAYIARAQSHLDVMVRPQVEKGLQNGYMLGYRDTHEFKLTNTIGNEKAFEQIFKIVKTKKHSGLKQNPFLLGENFTTSETLGRVLLAVLTKQVGKYQNIIASFLNDLIRLHLILRGFDVPQIEVKFSPPMIGDELKEIQAESGRIDNVLKKIGAGIIDMQQGAEELGYEKAFSKTLLTVPTTGGGDKANGADKETPTGKKTDPANNTAADIVTADEVEQLRIEAGGGVTGYDYGNESGDTCGCGANENGGDTGGHYTKETEFSDAYFGRVYARYQKSVLKITGEIGEALNGLPTTATVDDMVNTVLATIYRRWRGVFTDPIGGLIKKEVESIYRFFRRDTTPFRGTPAAKIPNSVFNLLDYRALEFWRGFDSFYLGKFISDPDTKTRVTAWLKEKYLGENTPIGKNPNAVADFRATFPEVLNGESWKIRRVIDTSVNKMRNFAAVSYLEQGGVAVFEIAGVNDRLQCKYCAALQGKQFSVKTAIKKIDAVLSAPAADTPTLTPFVTAVGLDAETMRITAGDVLAAKGVIMPPFHSHCRDVIIAVIEG